MRCLALALTVLGLLLPIGLAASANAAPLVPDSSFSGDGRATIAVADYNLAALAVAIAPDGKIVVAGEGTSRTGSPADWAIAVARFLPDGTPDPSFGADGLVVTQTSTLGGPPLARKSGATGVVVLPDRRIVIAGYTTSPEGFSFRADLQVVRYTESGELDTTFGEGDGMAIAPFTERAYGIGLALGPGGTLVTVGQLQADGSSTGWGVARFTAAGVPDATFSGDGVDVVDVHPNEYETVEAVAVQQDGSIVAAGWSLMDESDHDPVVVLTRHDTHGALDPQFDADGRAIIDGIADAAAFAVAIQPDGKIVVGGFASSNSMVVRLTAGGALDTAFGTGGVTTTGPALGRIEGLAIGAGGTIFTGGWTHKGPMLGASDMFAGRVLPGGQADGVFSFAFGTSADAYAIAIQGDGRPVLAGRSYDGNAALRTDFGVMRLVEGSDSGSGGSSPTGPGTTTTSPCVSVNACPQPPLPSLTALPAFTQLVKLPSTKKCVSRRKFSIRLRVPTRSKVVEAVVKVNGKRVAVRRGNRLRSTVDLRSLPKGRFRVQVVLKLADGRKIRDTRRYRTCTPKRRRAR